MNGKGNVSKRKGILSEINNDNLDYMSDKVFERIGKNIKEDVNKNSNARHSHDNKTLLDGITQNDIDKWNDGSGKILSIDAVLTDDSDGNWILDIASVTDISVITKAVFAGTPINFSLFVPHASDTCYISMQYLSNELDVNDGSVGTMSFIGYVKEKKWRVIATLDKAGKWSVTVDDLSSAKDFVIEIHEENIAGVNDMQNEFSFKLNVTVDDIINAWNDGKDVYIALDNFLLGAGVVKIPLLSVMNEEVDGTLIKYAEFQLNQDTESYEITFSDTQINGYIRESNMQRRREKESILDESGELRDFSDYPEAYPTAKSVVEAIKKIETTSASISEYALSFDFNGYIGSKGNYVSLESGSFRTTDYIKVKSNEIIVSGTFSGLTSGLSYINFYDMEQKFIGNSLLSNGEAIKAVDEQIKLLSGTEYIRVTNHKNVCSNTKLYYRMSLYSYVEDKFDDAALNEKLFSKCLGFSAFSKFASVGDSLSVGYNTDSSGEKHTKHLECSWGQYVERTTGCKAHWTGVSGASCKAWLTSTSSEWGLNYCKTLGQMPLYVICMGANESASGSIEDIGTDNDTLYAYISKVISELRTISPNSYIVCTGISRKQSNRAVNTVYKDICNHFEKCYYLDCETEFNSEPLSSYYNDFHYNANGYAVIANLFNYKLSEIMKNNIEDFRWINKAELID